MCLLIDAILPSIFWKEAHYNTMFSDLDSICFSEKHPMDKAQFDQLVTFLQPHMADPDERRALVELALHGCSVLGQIDWRGAAVTFTIRLLRTLDEYGSCEPNKPAIVALLETLREQVGSDKQAQIDLLINTFTPLKGNTLMINEAAAVGFLIEIGRWAKTELGERWKLRRKQQEADLSDKEQVETDAPLLLKEAVAAQSEMAVSRTLALIERKRDAIYRARNAKLADKEQLDRQEMLQAPYEERLKRHNATIREMLNEIEGDLETLGFKVTRETGK